MAKKNENLFTPGNIILGIIVVVLVGSLFFDFFGGSEEAEGVIGCPQAIEGLIVSNVAYTGGDDLYFEDRLVKPEPEENVTYKVAALLRNIGDEDIVIRNLLLTLVNFGPGEVQTLDEPLVIQPNGIASFEQEVPRGDYHKIDLYADACNGNIIWHEIGAGGRYQWEIDEEAAQLEAEGELLETEA